MLPEYTLKELEERYEMSNGSLPIEYILLKKHGVVLTPMQFQLMFFKRQYGKTFMELCTIIPQIHEIYESGKDEMQISCLRGADIFLFESWNMEHTNRRLNLLDAFEQFLIEYYKDYVQIINKSRKYESITLKVVRPLL